MGGVGQQDSSTGKALWIKNADMSRLVSLLELCVRAELGTAGERKVLWGFVRARLRELKSATYFRFDLPTIKQLKDTIKLYAEKLHALGATDYDSPGRKFFALSSPTQAVQR